MARVVTAETCALVLMLRNVYRELEDKLRSCKQVCNRRLSPGTLCMHTCNELCHAGECPEAGKCTKTSKVKCVCGRQKVTLPCAQALKPVECNQECELLRQEQQAKKKQQAEAARLREQQEAAAAALDDGQNSARKRRKGRKADGTDATTASSSASALWSIPHRISEAVDAFWKRYKGYLILVILTLVLLSAMYLLVSLRRSLALSAVKSRASAPASPSQRDPTHPW